MHGWKETFSVVGEIWQMSIVTIVFFSVQSAAGYMRSVQWWKMLDPPFSGLSVERHSLRDWRPAVRTGMQWQRLSAASPWCSLVIVRVMPCGRKNTDSLTDWNALTEVLNAGDFRPISRFISDMIQDHIGLYGHGYCGTPIGTCMRST